MQNHLLQVMALVAMEQPLAFTAEHIMAEKLKVLQACEPLTRDNLVVGQYVLKGTHPALRTPSRPRTSRPSCPHQVCALWQAPGVPRGHDDREP
jgi:hypothetical protein